MGRALTNFEVNIDRVHHLGGLYDAICRITTPAVDCSDILRSQIVLAVSALDYFFHEIVLEGMVDIYTGKRKPTPAYKRYNVSLELLLSESSGLDPVRFESVIREKLSYMTFQQPDKISEAIKLFSDRPIWSLVSTHMALQKTIIKETLRLIVQRRNKIAHEADIDPSYPGLRWPISVPIVRHTVEFIDKLCKSVDSIVAIS